MFFIMGINRGQKELPFDQVEICPVCGKYGHLKVFVVYTYLMLFFIPVFKWNKKYFVRLSCCGETTELNSEVGESIEQGQLHHLNMESLHFRSRSLEAERNKRNCPACGYSTEEDYDFCPKCGTHLEKA